MLKLACQFIIRNKKKSLAILFSIILSVALLAGTGALLLSANISKSTYYAEINGNYQYSYVLNGEQLGKLPEVLKSSKTDIVNSGITVNLYSTDEPRVMTIMGCNSEYLEMNGISLLDGRMPQKTNEIVLEQWTVGNLGLEKGIGESLEIDHKNFQIVGVASDSYEKHAGLITAYTKLADNALDENQNLYVNFNISKDIEKQSIELMNEFGCENKDRRANWDVIEPLGYKAPTDERVSFLSVIKGISMDENMVTLLFGIFSAFIIYSIFNVSMMQRMQQYGILEAIGAGGRHLFAIIFSEIFILFLVGFPIGCALGTGCAKVLYNKFSHIFLNYDITPASFVISKKVIINGFFLLLLLLFVVAVKTVFAIKRQTNVVIVKNINKNLLKDRRILAPKNKSLLFSISYRYMTLKRNVFLGVLFSLAIGGIIFCSTDYAIQEAKQENQLTMKSDDGLNSDYLISMQTSAFTQGLSDQDIKELEEIKGVDSVSPVKHFLGATFIPDEKYTQKHFFDPENEDQRLKEYFSGICTLEPSGDYLIKGNLYGYGSKMLGKLNDYLIEGSIDEQAMEQENGVIVCLPQDGGTLKFDTINLKPGDSISVKVPKSLDAKDEILKFQSNNNLYEVKEFKILATVKRVMAHNDYFVGSSGLDIIMTNSMMHKEFGIDNYNIVSLTKKASVPGKTISKEIQEIVRNIERCNFADYTSLIEKENMNLQQRQIFFMGLSIIIIFISMFHILNSMNYMIITRKQDFGILRAMGLSNRNFRSMILKEGVLYGVYSSIIMVIGIVCVTGLLLLYLKNVSLLHEPQFKLNWTYIGGCMAANILLSIIAVFIASRPILQEEVIACMKKGE